MRNPISYSCRVNQLINIILCSYFLPTLLLIFLQFISINVAYAGERPLPKPFSRFTNGYFYLTSSTGDGAVNVTECTPVKKLPQLLKKNRYFCKHKGKGYRCVSSSTLDVIFVFNNRNICVSDRKDTLDQEE